MEGYIKIGHVKVQGAYHVTNFGDEAIYFTGGSIEFNRIRRTSSSVIRFDLQLNEASRGPNLDPSRESHSSCTLGSKIYVFGGVTKIFRQESPCD